MPAYEYTAVKNDGSEMNGSIEGDNEKHIRVILRDHPRSLPHAEKPLMECIQH